MTAAKTLSRERSGGQRERKAAASFKCTKAFTEPPARSPHLALLPVTNLSKTVNLKFWLHTLRGNQRNWNKATHAKLGNYPKSLSLCFLFHLDLF